MALPQPDLFKSALSAFRAKKYGEAFRMSTQLIEVQAGRLDVQILHAILTGETGHREEAVEKLQKLQKVVPNSIDINNWLAENLGELGRTEEVEQIANRLLQFAPKSPAGLLHLGRVHLKHGRNEEAAACFEKGAALDPKLGLMQKSLGVALIRLSDYQGAERALKKAIELDPGDVSAYDVLASVDTANQRHRSAAKWQRKVYELEPDTVRGVLALASALGGEGRFEEAAEAVQGALAKFPAAGPVHLAYLSQLQQEGDFDAVQKECRAAMELLPDSPVPYQTLIRSKKCTDEDRVLIPELERILRNEFLSTEDSATAHYALGKLHEDLKDYARAMEEFDRANGTMLERWRHWDDNANKRTGDQIAKIFSREALERYKAVGSQSEQPIFIVGMIRSGTTLTEQILSRHPDIGSVGETQYWLDKTLEPFFPQSVHSLPQRLKTLEVEFNTYLHRHGSEKKRITEKMPLNYGSLGAIRMTFPKSHVIHVRRSPVDNCMSIYTTPFAQGLNFGHSRERIVSYYRSYLRLMEHWRSVLPPENFLEIDYEDLVGDSEPVVRRMIEFVGLEWDDACLSPEDNERAVRTPSLWQVRQPVYKTSVERWRRYAPWLGAFKELLSPDQLASLEDSA